jgi:hypothetical protein
VTIIGLTGVSQVGKDTIAKVLIEDYGYQRVAFADAMRKGVYDLNPVIPLSVRPRYVHEYWRLQDVIDEIGWDEAKVKYPEIRRLLQVYGTECGRNVFGENVWVDLALKGYDYGDNIVITDVRFPNEAEAVHKRGGFVVKIVRPGIGPVNAHISDAGLPDKLIDWQLVNDGSIEDLPKMASILVRWEAWKREQVKV